MVTPSRLSELNRVRRVGAAILRRQEGLRNEVLTGSQLVEEFLFDAASRRGEPSFKPLRTEAREEPVGAPPLTMGVTLVQAQEILARQGIFIIEGSGTFTIEELRDATIQTYFATERGFFAEMRFSPTGRPFYSPITREEAGLLRGGEPPPELLARLFTEIEPVDN